MSRYLAAGVVLAFVALGPLACQNAGPPPVAAGFLRGGVLAGPTCPVVSEPADPACADRPVAGATLVIETDGGDEVARLTSDADGRFEVALVPGRYTVLPQPMAGLLGTAPSQQFVVEAEADTEIVVLYDTGIR